MLSMFIIITYIIDLQQPKDYPSYVSESPAPTGTKALYTYLDQQGEVDRWKHRPDLLAQEDQGQLLFMIQPSFIQNTDEMEAYEAFMEAGNTILLLRQNPQDMFGIKTTPVLEDIMESSEITSKNDAEYQATVASTVRINTDADDEILLSDDHGAIAVSRSFGNGHLIVSVTPEWLMNQNVLDDDNIPLLLSLLNQSTDEQILFDEYSHKGGQAFSLLTVYPKAFLVLMLQGILVTLLWLWYKGRRFGPVLVAREETVRYSNERLSAIGAWYLRGRRYQEALQIQSDYLRVVLQERWGLAYSKQWRELVDQLDRKWKQMSEEEIRSWVNDLTIVLTKEKVSKQEYLLWTKRLDRLRKEVEEG